MTETDASRGFELPLLLLGAFRDIIDELHRRLAEAGHPDARPWHGFALQAVGRGAATAAELGAAMGVSKQAAGKAVEKLEAQGYVRRVPHPDDARAKRIVVSRRGHDLLRRSEQSFTEIRSGWVDQLGERRVRALESTLLAVTEPRLSIDTPGWWAAPGR